MRKWMFIVFVLLVCSLQAQQELKLDIADGIGMKTIDISYEKFVSEDTSLGLSVLFNLNDETTDFQYNENFMLTPYVRHFFTTEYQWNFFGELFLGINSGKEESIADSENFDLDYTDAALGVAFGLKYVSNGGFVIDIHAGAGRNFFSDISPAIVPRVGVNVGWSF